jgi:hypothetical protein
MKSDGFSYELRAASHERTTGFNIMIARPLMARSS